MTTTTDFDRVLTAWLEQAGPRDPVPESVDAAFRAARARRQRRGPVAWLTGPAAWPAFGPRHGFTALPVPLRLAILVALLLALAGGAAAAGSRLLNGDHPPVSGGLPVGSWITATPSGMDFEYPGPPPALRLQLLDGKDGAQAWVGGSGWQLGARAFVSSARPVGPDEVEFVISLVTKIGGRGFEPGTPVIVDGVQLPGCKLGDVGRYRWAASSDGGRLTLTSLGDACPSREAVLSRAWGAGLLPATMTAALPQGITVDGQPVGMLYLDLQEDAISVRTSMDEAGDGFFRSAMTDAGRTLELGTWLAPDPVIALDGMVLEGCHSGDVGRYAWALAEDGTTLTLTSLGDACAARRAVLERPWTTAP